MAGTIVPSLRQRVSMAFRALSTPAFPSDPQSFSGRILGGIIPAGGQSVPKGTADYLRAYSHMPWLRAVVGRVSYDVAATEWRLYVAVDKGGRKVRNAMVQRASAPQRDILLRQMKSSGELEEIIQHPALDLLANANSVQTGLAARRVTQAHLDLVGEAFWLLERNPLGMPIGIWPLPPSWVTGTPSVQSPFYRVSFRGWQGTIPASEIIWYSDPDPLNPYGRGSGTSQALGDELETDEYASKHLKSFYQNNARPDLIVWPKGDQPLQDEQVERLEEGWNARSQGFWRRFKPFFLKREVEVKELSQNFQSQQIIDLRKYERDTIMQVFGVSPEVLGVVVGSNRATAAMSETIYQRRVLVPRLELQRTVMQERLMPLFDERIIVNYVSPVVRDAELELDAAKAFPAGPNVDEWRRMQGLDPLPDDKGKVHIGPMTYGPVEGLSAHEGPLPMPEGADDPEDEDEGDDEELLEGVEDGPDEDDADEKIGNAGALALKAWQARAKSLFDAGAAKHQGLLVSLWLDERSAQALAVPGGEPMSQLHITLAYCGDVAKIGDMGVARALLSVSQVASAARPLSGEVGGWGMFTGSASSDGKDVFYAVPDIPGLSTLREQLASALVSCGVPPRADHGWAPHITLLYAERGAQPPTVSRGVALEFGAVSVSVGDKRCDIPLGQVQ